MERRGYVKAGAWTPEATVEHPEASTRGEGVTALAASLIIGSADNIFLLFRLLIFVLTSLYE